MGIFGGSWGTTVQVGFSFTAIVLLLVLLSSGSYRAHIKVLIDKHFFPQRYDYRHEWLKFTDATAGSGSHYSLQERILHAVADILESPAAALWLQDSATYAVAASWNMAVSSFSRIEADALERFVKSKEWVFVLEQPLPQESSISHMPNTITQAKNGWILVPLLHHSDLIGFILLARPRAPRDLSWEDFDLLRTVGRQASGYLAEQCASVALAEAQQFELFNRRSAFVLHDIKNLVSQLSLLTRNLERHGEDPDFRRDMALTVSNVTAKMQQMIERLSAEESDPRATNAQPPVALAPLLREVADTRADFQDDDGAAVALTRGDRNRLASLFGHLVDNAAEAAGKDGWVKLSLFAQPDRLLVEVSDNGPGMEERFIREHLFTPFRSTKTGGFGLGVYQCRVYARELGGDLEVISSPGAGTTVRVSLPIVVEDPKPLHVAATKGR